MNKGDIIYCQISSMGNKSGRPCVIIDINNTELTVLPITSKGYNKNKKIQLEISFIRCCSVLLTGYLFLERVKVDKGYCSYANCSACEVSNTLKIILLRYGIKF